MSSVTLHSKSVSGGPEGTVSSNQQQQAPIPQTSPISSAPIEVLGIVFRQIPDYKDKAHFSGVSKLFNTVARSYEQDHPEEYDSARQQQSIPKLKGRIAKINREEREIGWNAEVKFQNSQGKLLSLVNAQACVGPFKSIGGFLGAVLSNTFLKGVFSNNYLSAEMNDAHNNFKAASSELAAAQKKCQGLKTEAQLLACELMRLVEKNSGVVLSNDELDMLLTAAEDRKPTGF